MLNPGKIICPFCFSSFAPEKVRFRCTQPVSRCPGWENDDKYARMRQLPVTKMGHVFEINTQHQDKRNLTMGIPHSHPCDICFAESYTHLCPDCHFELSHDVGQVKQKIIAVIGGRGTGKSHYIGSLIFALKANPDNDLIVTLLADSTQDRWMEDFYRPVFERKTVLPGTVPAGRDTRVKIPLMIRLNSKENEWKRRMNGLWDQAINMSIFDTAGEDMADYNTLANEGKAVIHADGLIFMIDPAQIESVQQQLRNVRTVNPDPRAHPDNMLARVIKFFETEGAVKPGTGKIRVPTAFVLSKVDVLEDILYGGSALLRPSTHGRELNLAEVQSVSTEVQGYLTSWLLPSFCETIEKRFSTYKYFGVSSLGRQSNVQHQLEVVEPLRVEEPALWLLNKMGFVKGR